MKLELKTAQTTWILYPASSIERVKAHLRVDHTDDDDYILELVKRCEERIKQEYGIYLSNATYTGYLDEFPTHDKDGTDEIELWMWPVKSITTVKYYDATPTLQTVSSANYKTDLVGRPARIVPYDSYVWPETKYTYPNAVEVEFQTGFNSPETTPDDIEHAMLLVIGDWYENREDKGIRYTRLAHKILQKYRY